MSAVPTKLPFVQLQLQRLSGMEIGERHRYSLDEDSL